MPLASRRRFNASSLALAASAWVGVPGASALAQGGAPTGALENWKGKVLPPIELVDLEGSPAPLERWKGSVLVVNLWATWCAPCLEELPALDLLRHRLQGRGAEVLAINVSDGLERITRFLADQPLEMPVLRDRRKSLMSAWRVGVLPTTFLFDRRGQPRHRLVGQRQWNEADLRQALDVLLAEKV